MTRIDNSTEWISMSRYSSEILFIRRFREVKFVDEFVIWIARNLKPNGSLVLDVVKPTVPAAQNCFSRSRVRVLLYSVYTGTGWSRSSRFDVSKFQRGLWSTNSRCGAISTTRWLRFGRYADGHNRFPSLARCDRLARLRLMTSGTSGIRSIYAFGHVKLWVRFIWNTNNFLNTSYILTVASVYWWQYLC